MIQLQTTDSNKLNRSLVLPYIGEVIVPRSGIIEAPNQELAALIVEANVGFELFQGSFEVVNEDSQNVAAIILENSNLKEENSKLSFQVASLKKENQTLLINQKPISVAEQPKPIVEQQPKVTPIVEQQPKPAIPAVKPIEKVEVADSNTKISPILVK